MRRMRKVSEYIALVVAGAGELGDDWLPGHLFGTSAEYRRDCCTAHLYERNLVKTVYAGFTSNWSFPCNLGVGSPSTYSQTRPTDSGRFPSCQDCLPLSDAMLWTGLAWKKNQSLAHSRSVLIYTTSSRPVRSSSAQPELGHFDILASSDVIIIPTSRSIWARASARAEPV